MSTDLKRKHWYLEDRIRRMHQYIGNLRLEREDLAAKLHGLDEKCQEWEYLGIQLSKLDEELSIAYGELDTMEKHRSNTEAEIRTLLAIKPKNRQTRFFETLVRLKPTK